MRTKYKKSLKFNRYKFLNKLIIFNKNKINNNKNIKIKKWKSKKHNQLSKNTLNF